MIGRVRGLNPSRSNGFTLIELLVVIAIIGILASIILASLTTAQAKGRDARRISDIKELQLALSLYYDANNAYPINLYNGNPPPLVAGGYISVMPFDPKFTTPCTSDGSSDSCYAYTSICTTANPTNPIGYHLGATLETSNSALSSAVDMTALPTGEQVCNGSTPTSGFSGLSYSTVGSALACSGPSGTAYPGTQTCYDVTQ